MKLKSVLQLLIMPRSLTNVGAQQESIAWSANKVSIKQLTNRLMLLTWLLALLLSCNTTAKKEKSTIVDVMKSEKLITEVLSKSWNLLQQAQLLADNGNSIDEIIKILPDSTIVQTNGSAILFFIDGSVPMVIELPKAADQLAATKGGGKATFKSLPAQSTGLFASMNLVSSEDNEDLVDVVTSEKGEEEREKKKALVLSPYLNSFGSEDDGLVAKEHLEKNKNYKGRVKFLSQEINLSTYASFADYDIVHLSTHAQRFCHAESFANNSDIEISYAGDSNFCRTLIETGIKHSFESPAEIDEFLTANPHYKDLLFFSTTAIYLKSTFFDYYYSGLNDKIWVFSACELGQRSDLGESMKSIHTNGHFFYWLNSVDAKHAKAAFEKFYEYLEKEGLDAKTAFEKIPAELKSNLPSNFDIEYDSITPDGNSIVVNDTIETKTSLLHIQTGMPRHGIEIIEMWHPEKNTRIKEDVFYPLVGDFGDGKEEAITLKVKLKGYTPAEFEERSMTISLKVDDEIVLSKKPFLPDEEADEIEIKNLEGQEYGVEVTIADIAIPDVGEKKELVLKAILHLND